MENKDIFCRIIAKEIPCYTLYEDDDVLAFLDIGQVTKGHALVLPKKHYKSFLETPKEVMHKVLDVAQEIANKEMAVLNAKGVNILMNCNEEAGQTVMHYHVHVIPRYGNDENMVVEFKEHDVNYDLKELSELIRL